MLASLFVVLDQILAFSFFQGQVSVAISRLIEREDFRVVIFLAQASRAVVQGAFQGGALEVRAFLVLDVHIVLRDDLLVEVRLYGVLANLTVLVLTVRALVQQR